MARAPRWMFGWADRFTDTWGALPAEPILYFFMLTGLLQIIITPRAVSQSTLTPIWISDLWRISGLVSPLLCVLAWYLVNKRTGRARLMGLWVRFAGDFGQAIALAVFLVIRSTSFPVDDDAHVYLMHIVAGVLFFVCMLVLRDVWILVKVEEIAAHLERLGAAEDRFGELK